MSKKSFTFKLTFDCHPSFSLTPSYLVPLSPLLLWGQELSWLWRSKVSKPTKCLRLDIFRSRIRLESFGFSFSPTFLLTPLQCLLDEPLDIRVLFDLSVYWMKPSKDFGVYLKCHNYFRITSSLEIIFGDTGLLENGWLRSNSPTFWRPNYPSSLYDPYGHWTFLIIF